MAEIEIVNMYLQDVPAMRFIGKRYGDEDRVDGGFGARWGEWDANGWMVALTQHLNGVPGGRLDVEDGDACIGLMRWKEDEPFQYWIGMFAAGDAPVPEGCAAVEFPPSTFGICWLRGKEPDIFGKEMMCADRLKEAGHEIATDERQAYWFFERYATSRFMAHVDGGGDVILDIGHFISR